MVTDWQEFGELDYALLASKMTNPIIIDGRNYLDPEALTNAGFTYIGIGRPTTFNRPPAKVEIKQNMFVYKDLRTN